MGCAYLDHGIYWGVKSSILKSNNLLNDFINHSSQVQQFIVRRIVTLLRVK